MLNVTWEQFQSYLHVKLRLDKANYYKSCYNLTYIYFTDKNYTEENLQHFLLYIENRNISRSTYNNYLKALKHLSRLQGFHFLDTYKLKKLEKPYIPILEESQILRLLTICYKKDYRRALAVEMLVKLGLRRQELIDLKWTALREDMLHITNTKTDKSRTIVLLPYLKNKLKKLRNNHEIYIFATCAGKLNARFFNEFLRKCAKEAGLTEYLTLHKLRHTYATYADEQGVSMFTLMELLGHTDIRTTQTYVHTTRTAKREAAKKVSMGSYKLSYTELMTDANIFVTKLQRSGIQAMLIPQDQNIVIMIPKPIDTVTK